MFRFSIQTPSYLIGQTFDDNMMTVAAIDRIVHHATVIDRQGESYRKKQALKKEGKSEIAN